ERPTRAELPSDTGGSGLNPTSEGCPGYTSSPRLVLESFFSVPNCAILYHSPECATVERSAPRNAPVAVSDTNGGSQIVQVRLTVVGVPPLGGAGSEPPKGGTPTAPLRLRRPHGCD